MVFPGCSCKSQTAKVSMTNTTSPCPFHPLGQCCFLTMILFLMICTCVCSVPIHVSVHRYVYMTTSAHGRNGIRPLGAGITGTCELPAMGARNWSWVICNSNTCPSPLSSFFKLQGWCPSWRVKDVNEGRLRRVQKAEQTLICKISWYDKFCLFFFKISSDYR